MNKATRVLIALGVLGLIGVGLTSLLSGGDDQKLIQDALKASIQAGKEGKPGGVMEMLSMKVKLNDTEFNGGSREIANFIKNSKPDLSFSNSKAIITGDEARIISPAHIEVQILTNKVSRDLSAVTLVFKREDDRAYLIFPAKKWKLTEVIVDPSQIGDLTSGA